LPFAYIGTGTYKIILQTSGGDVLDTEDDIPGALDTSTFATATYARPDTDCAAKTIDYTVLAADLGTVLNVNPTSAAITITLISAVSATNGRGVTIRHTGTANQVNITSVSAQTISQPATGVTTTAFSLIGYGESVTLVSDGAGWHVTASVPPLMRPNTPGVIQIADRVSAEPVSPAAGARYIVAAAFSTFEQEDIIEADGQGGFIEYTPPTDCGWIAYVQDEDVNYQFVGSGWRTGPTLLQRSITTTSNHSTLSTAVPSDATAPTITEGDDVFGSVSFTPKSALSTLIFHLELELTNGSTGVAIASIFHSSTNLARVYTTVNSTKVRHILGHSMASPGVSAQTFTVRAGGSTGAVTLNGASGTNLSGIVSRLTIEEWIG
jgi:hypothetical protein